MPVAAIVGGGLGLVGSLVGADASKSAADTQAQAAQNAAQLQFQQFQQLQKNLSLYMNLGSQASTNLWNLLNSPNKDLTQQFSFNPTQSQLEQTPGYQFTLNQGLNTLDNQLASKGLNLSGAQLRGAQNYAQGLASTTYQQQYQNALQNFMTNYGVNSDYYNRLAGLTNLGENAAAGVGNAGMQTAMNAGNFLTSGANAQAAGTIGAANAFGGGLGSVGSNALLYSLMNPSAGGGGGGSIYGNSAGTTPQDLISGYTG